MMSWNEYASDREWDPLHERRSARKRREVAARAVTALVWLTLICGCVAFYYWAVQLIRWAW